MFEWQSLLIPITASLVVQVIIKVISFFAQRTSHNKMLEEVEKQTALLQEITDTFKG